jgi:hypothetical protein
MSRHLDIGAVFISLTSLAAALPPRWACLVRMRRTVKVGRTSECGWTVASIAGKPESHHEEHDDQQADASNKEIFVRK